MREAITPFRYEAQQQKQKRLHSSAWQSTGLLRIVKSTRLHKCEGIQVSGVQIPLGPFLDFDIIPNIMTNIEDELFQEILKNDSELKDLKKQFKIVTNQICNKDNPNMLGTFRNCMVNYLVKLTEQKTRVELYVRFFHEDGFIKEHLKELKNNLEQASLSVKEILKRYH